MNESSGGTSQNGVYHLTEAEEAALLAEYGTEGLLDDTVDWAAPSQFKSHLGDGDVFLTGAAADAASDDDGATGDANHHRISAGGGATARGAHTDPLTLYLLRNTPSLILPTRSTPASLAHPISNLVSTFEVGEEGRGDDEGGSSEKVPAAGGFHEEKAHATSRFAPVLRSGKEWERRASLAVQGISTTAFAAHLLSAESNNRVRAGGPVAAATRNGSADSNPVTEVDRRDAEYEKLIGATATMLSDADDLLEQLTEPHEAAAVEEEVAEMQRREALVSEDVLDQHWEREEVLRADEDDADTRELLQRAQASRQRLRDVLTATRQTGTDAVRDTSKSSAAEHTNVGSAVEKQRVSMSMTTIKDAAAVALLPDADYLYAFEMELPRMSVVPDAAEPMEAESTAALAAACLSARIEEPVGVPKSVPPPVVLSTSGTMEEAAAVLLETDEGAIPQLLLRSSAMLDAIATAEQRDAQLLRQFTSAQQERAQLRRRAMQPRSGGGEGGESCVTKKRIRDALGLVALPSFVERLDVLLTPTQEEQRERQRRRDSREGAACTSGGDDAVVRRAAPPREHTEGDKKAKAEVKDGARPGMPATCPTTPTPASLEQIRRHAAVESFLLQRELEEGRRMRREDELVEREALAAEELQRLHADQRAALQDDAARRYDALCAEAAAAFKELSTANVKDAALARQVERLRELQQVEALAYTLMMEWEVHREQLMEDEALSFRRLTRDAAEAKAQAAAAAEKRESAEAAAARAYIVRLQNAFEETRAALRVQSAAFSGDTEDSYTASTHLQRTFWYRWRIQPLLEERAHVAQWAVAQCKQLESVRELLVDAGVQYRRHLAPKLPTGELQRGVERVLRVPAAPPDKRSSAWTADGDRSVTAGAGALTAERLLRVLWPAFRAAVEAPAQATQYLARWNLSLEDIDSIDWKDLQSLTLQRVDNEGEKAKAFVAACRLVKDIDLSGNALASLDALQVVRTFPALQRLTVTHSHLTTLESADTTQAAMPRQGSAQRTGSAATQEDRRASSASLSASTHLRHISAARNHALAEQVHLLEADFSSNTLTSLHPLGILATASLTRCTAVDNQLTSLDSIAACTQLRGVAVARNQLRSMQSLHALRLLRELDVGNNELTGLDETSAAVGGEGKAGGMGNPVPLWCQLFISHNRLPQLPPSLQRVYPCLSQLFLNHNQLTALDAEAMAWFPLLRVLQAEGNMLVDITGLQHCTRLESVKLSHNQLSTVEALYPLSSCRRLKALDVSGNPLFSDGEASKLGAAGSDGGKAASLLAQWLPWLEELNNTPLTRQAASQRSRSAPSSAAPPLELFGQGFAAAGAVIASESYTDVFAALCWDDMAWHIQDERERCEAVIARGVNRAKGWEATIAAEREAATTATELRTAHGSGGGTAATTAAAAAALYGVTAAQRDTRRAEQVAEQSLFALDHTTVSKWHAVAEQCARAVQRAPTLPSDLVLFSNRHEVHGAYRQREEDHLQRLARAYIAEWLVARVRICRARRELRQLQAAHRSSEAFRREAAARRIQPLWRGAALRSRLRRLLHGHSSVDSDDDVDTFAKVNVDDWLTEDPAALAPVELLLGTVVGARGGVGAVPFNVPLVVAPSKIGAAAAGDARAAPLLPSSVAASSGFTPTPPLASGEPRRVNTGTASGRPAPRLTEPRTESAAGRNNGGNAGHHRSDTTGGPAKSGETLEEQWGPAVAAQIRKKQQKNTRATNERMRKEFMQDPLRVQQEMRGAQAGHKSK